MKLIQFVLASKVSGGYYQKWKHLSATEKTERQVTCDAKTEETKALFVIENGAWNCPNLGLTRPRVVCDPTCLPGYKPNWTDGSISKPKKDHPRFMTRCGNPANIAKRNLPSGIQLACTPIPEHPCMATAAGVTIPNGSLSLNTELTPARATFDVVCDWGDHGQALLQQRLVSFLEKSRIRNDDQRLRG
ncbi:Oidioi.mRNA.OKI2018_I69.chr1.g1573.t1.cds [Oikopleura dioica]|uniref:Oidioi.mRNA.OKI2018_I69.chr1.g1573.t1.cds n=1 Tax=Oikopleura dioica TaxID=34765 RepID=A0ABN7SSK8_OIKDI|nr:Oidioi.mRNA.OKI2018_I69.chr1.g1573.t1.cds [Oikopleura dioica]